MYFLTSVLFSLVRFSRAKKNETRLTGDDFHVALDLEPAHRKAWAGFSASLQQLKDSCHLGQEKREAAKSRALTLVPLPEFMPAHSGYSSLSHPVSLQHTSKGAQAPPATAKLK